MTAFGQQSCQQPEIGGLRAGEIGAPYPGPPSLVGDRDACGVGFLADQKGRRRHDIMARALVALGCMEHRGGCGGDSVSGDGAGVLTSVPWELFEADGHLKGHSSDSCGVAMTFLPTNAAEANQVKGFFEAQAKRRGLEVLGWRAVPQRKEVLGPMALAALPDIQQCFVHHPTARGDELESLLYEARRSIQADIKEGVEAGGSESLGETYIAAFSSRTIVYKGMTQSAVLGPFYEDLQDPRYFTNFAIYHRRFSTNTVPKWPLAQPMRMLAHNGEINTLLGNVNWQRALDAVRGRRDPLVSLDRSDSANLDSVFEHLRRNTDIEPAMAIGTLVPEAYRDQPDYDEHPEVVEMLEYYAGIQEAWDGPALLTFCDGKQIGAQLDRNGLRPARVLLTNDGLLAMMSETGVVDVKDEDVLWKGRLGPGLQITMDLETGEIRKNVEVKSANAAKAPYGAWLRKHKIQIAPADFGAETAGELGNSTVQQMTAFGWSLEDLDMQVAPLYLPCISPVSPLYLPCIPCISPGHAGGRHVQRGQGDPLLPRQRRAARRPLAEPEHRLRLLQAALRAGDQPPHRPAARGRGHGARHVARPPARPDRRALGGSRQAAARRVAAAQPGGHGRSLRGRGEAGPRAQDPLHPLPALRRTRGPRGRGEGAVRGGGGGGA